MIGICEKCLGESGLLLWDVRQAKMVCEDCFTIPKDQYSSGNRDDQCWAKLYGRTEEEAKAKKKRYFDTYPTPGYNTHVAQEGWSKGGYYYILIDRWHSCD